MKKILVNARFLTRPITGVERYAREMINALQNLGNPGYRFILAAPKGAIVNLCSDIELVQDSSNLQGHLWEQIHLPCIMKKTESDILWSPCTSGPLQVKKQITTIHDASVFATPESFRQTYVIYYKVLLPLLSKRVLRVITDSEFSKSELVNYKVAAPEKISVIHGGVNTNNFFNNKENIKINYGRYLLSIGSRDPRKNISTLLKAWQMITPERKQGARLIIAGGQGPGFAKENLVYVSEDVIFLGYVAEEMLSSLYAGAVAFVYPSIYEGFGLPPLEAMACGTPTLVSKAASLPEICGDAALYCDALNANDIAEKIVQLLADDALQEQLRQKGFRQIKQFAWQISAQQLMLVFEEAMASGN